MFGSKQKEPKFKFNLGDEVKDLITGFSGIVYSRTQWIHNCNTYGIKSKTLKDNKPMDNEFFDEPQLQIIAEKQIKEDRETGGPCSAVPQTNR